VLVLRRTCGRVPVGARTQVSARRAWRVSQIANRGHPPGRSTCKLPAETMQGPQRRVSSIASASKHKRSSLVADDDTAADGAKHSRARAREDPLSVWHAPRLCSVERPGPRGDQVRRRCVPGDPSRRMHGAGRPPLPACSDDVEPDPDASVCGNVTISAWPARESESGVGRRSGACLWGQVCYANWRTGDRRSAVQSGSGGFHPERVVAWWR
jgi:hypothetical protein